MKWIKYQILQNVIDEEEIFIEKKVGYSEANLAIAGIEAHNGEYEIIEDEEEIKFETVPGLYVVTFSGRTYPDSADKTFDEIYKAVLDGKNVIGRHPYSTGYEYYQLTRYTDSVLSFTHFKEMYYDSSNQKMSNMYEVRLVRFMKDGTFKRKVMTLNEQSVYDVWLHDVVSFDSNYIEDYEMDENLTLITRNGNQIFASIYLNPLSDDAKRIKDKSSSSDLRDILVPRFVINEEYKPLVERRDVSYNIFCNDVDSAGGSSISQHNLSGQISSDGVIFEYISSINSKSATDVAWIVINCSWAIKED